MAELRKCSRCKSLITLEHYSLNGKMNTFNVVIVVEQKVLNTGENTGKKWDCEIRCDKRGERTTKNCKSIHKRRYWCQIYGMNPRPNFEEWLKEQGYDTLLWEYKKVLDEKQNNDKQEEEEEIQNNDKEEHEEITDKEAVDKCIAEINYWDKKEKEFVDEYDGDIIKLSQNPRFNIVKNISDTIRMNCYIKYKNNPSIIKYISNKKEIRNMGYKQPKDYVK